MAEFMTNFCLD